MKILTLYACLGGNRYKWENVKVTAVERDPYLAEMYQDRFPNDEVIVGDAHAYLLEHFQEFDFIWSSPPCPTHSRARFWSSSNPETNVLPVYPDMTLYQEIIFLEHYFKGKYCVENVIPYYEPLIPAKKRGRHLFWTNFPLPNILSERKIKISTERDEVAKLSEFHEIDLSKYQGSQRKDKIARNLVDYEVGKTILDVVQGIYQANNARQYTFF